MEFLMSVIDAANARLLATFFKKLAKLFCDLARTAEDRRITREVANDLCRLSDSALSQIAPHIELASQLRSLSYLIGEDQVRACRGAGFDGEPNA
jgi:hypothetical protein